MFDLDLDYMVKEVQDRQVKKVMIQLPEGIKSRLIDIVTPLQKIGVEVIVSGDPCYGGCDLADQEAVALGADILIHFGHTPMPPKSKLPTLYIPTKSNVSINKILNKLQSNLHGISKLGLTATIQHLDELHQVKSYLEQKGFEIFIGKAGGCVHYNGQVLGCDYTCTEAIAHHVDAFLFIGGGEFHPLGIALKTGRKVIAADPFTAKISDLKNLYRRTLKNRAAAIVEGKKAKNVGIIIGLKSGQIRIALAQKLMQKSTKMGVQAVLIAMREFVPEQLLNMGNIELFVVTACPRIAIEDDPRLRQPILTSEEFEVVLDERSFEEVYPPSTEY